MDKFKSTIQVIGGILMMLLFPLAICLIWNWNIVILKIAITDLILLVCCMYIDNSSNKKINNEKNNDNK